MSPAPTFVNAFIGKAKQPTEVELHEVLGPAKKLWMELVDDLAATLGINVQEWGSSSKKLGWSLRLKIDKRIIVYLAPGQRCFQASFALSDKAVQAALAGHLPESTVKIIRGAKRYAEGTGVRLEVRTPKDVAVVKKLAAIKIQS